MAQVKVYKKSFAAELASIDSMMIWVESCLADMNFKTPSAQVDSTAKGANLRKDHIALGLFEFLSNVIEHSVLGISKLQLYELPYTSRAQNQKVRKNAKLHCHLSVGVSIFVLRCNAPLHKQFVSFAKPEIFAPQNLQNLRAQSIKPQSTNARIGKKGLKILASLGARASFRIPKRFRFSRAYAQLCMRF